LIFGTIEYLFKNVIFVRHTSDLKEDWQSRLIFRDDFQLKQMKSTFPSQLYKEFLPISPEVLYEVFLQREFVPQNYWEFYPETLKQIISKTTVEILLMEEEEEDKLAIEEIREDNFQMEKKYQEDLKAVNAKSKNFCLNFFYCKFK